MEPIFEPTRSDRRLPLLVMSVIAVLAGLAIVFAWPW